MIMKVLGFVGSPRANGNTAALVSQVLAGAKASGAEVELIQVPDLTISGCRGCKYCKSHETCRINDDMQTLYAKIREADRLVFGTPVYFAQMTGQMKLFIDRLYALIDAEYASRIPAGKVASIVITQGDENPESFTAIAGTFGFAMSFLSVDVVAPLIVPGLDKPNDVEKNPAYLSAAFKMGQDLIISS